jgi:acetyltransferase-like isoleucine patch superfamily enzyme
MRPILRALRNAWLDWRTWRWLLRLRFELRRNGGRLKVEGWRGIRMAEPPRIRTLPLGEGGGVTTLRLSPEVLIGYGMLVEIRARDNNLLEIGRGSQLQEGVRLDLRGGSIRIGDRCLIHANAVLKSDGELILGDEVRVSFGTCLHCNERIELRDFAGLAECVTLVDSDHLADGSDTPFMSQPIESEPILIDTNTFVARGAVVMRGARIGKNSVVAANSVVTRGEYPSSTLIAGAPAKAARALKPRA